MNWQATGSSSTTRTRDDMEISPAELSAMAMFSVDERFSAGPWRMFQNGIQESADGKRLEDRRRCGPLPTKLLLSKRVDFQNQGGRPCPLLVKHGVFRSECR